MIFAEGRLCGIDAAHAGPACALDDALILQSGIVKQNVRGILPRSAEKARADCFAGVCGDLAVPEEIAECLLPCRRDVAAGRLIGIAAEAKLAGIEHHIALAEDIVCVALNLAFLEI